MKTKSIIIGAGIILLFFAGNSVLAQHGMKMAANQTAKMACVPDLTDEQESQITQLRTEFSAATKNLRADMQIKKAELDKLKIQDTPNRTNINAKIDEITALRTEMQKKRTKMHLDIRELLTDEQKQLSTGIKCTRDIRVCTAMHHVNSKCTGQKRTRQNIKICQ